MYPQWLVAALMPLMIGCAQPERNVTAEEAPPSRPPVPTESVETGTVLFLGTSLTAGYGLPTEDAFPARIQQKIDSAGLPYRVTNAGVSGETSAGARRRVAWLLRQPFDVLVLETGSNDMLRGADLDSTRANIQAIIEQVREERPEAELILVGMMAPPNLGSAYTERFGRIFVDLAAEYDLTLVPFLLEGVAGVSAMNLPDGIHPNAEGQRIVARTVWEVLEPRLQLLTANRSRGALR
jgi:acyl-CoA thioesterase I